MRTIHISSVGRLMAILGIALGPGPIATAAASSFVQVQRVNSLTLQTGTDAFAPANALGGAFVGTVAQNSMASDINSGIQDGSISWLLEMSGLGDLTGTSNPSFNVGMLDAVPQEPAGNPTSYSGASDLDWWYTANPADVDVHGAPLAQLSATFSDHTFAAGPGNLRLEINFAGSPLTLAVSDARVQATSGASSSPTESPNGFPPGHLPAEHLDPALTSFGSMTAGEFAGNISAQSLADAQVPSGLTGNNCTLQYTTANTWLDVLVSGCNFGGLSTQVKATQPDQVTSTGTGSYVFTSDSNHHVTGCKHDGNPDTMADCLAGAAYSVYFHLTTDRVILRHRCVPGSYSSDGYDPCAPADRGYYVAGAGATTETPCPTGMTSVSPGATSCDFFITTTGARCSGSSVVIGVATTCTATVADMINGPVPSGPVHWSRPAGGGSLSASSCALVASAGRTACSVHYTPAPGSAGSQKLGAAYRGDDGHAGSGGHVSLKVIRRSTAIKVSCRPTTIVHGKSTLCTATVADTSSGIAVAPKGRVKWAAPSRDGTFTVTTCALASHNGSRACSVSFKTTKALRGQFSLSASYVGDASHNGKTGTARLDVT